MTNDKRLKTNAKIKQIRSHFPFLKRKFGRQGFSLAYLDNASTTQKPQAVIDAIDDVYKNHYANIVPWQMLKSRHGTRNMGQGIKIKYIPIDREGKLELGKLDKLVTKKTKILSVALMSNVLGTINDVAAIIKKAKKICPGLIAIVDAAQAAAHMKIEVGDLDCDFLTFSAHKMYGPTGVGVLWGRKEILESMPPFMGGGDMILSVSFEKTIFNELPWKFEAGNPN